MSLRDKYISKRFGIFFAVNFILGIAAVGLNSYIEYKGIYWPLFLTLMLGDLTFIFIAYEILLRSNWKKQS